MGPPFATGLPHYGTLLSSIAKDIFPRYKTMQGYHVRRRWGWDCHGLPIENMIEKDLGLSSKKEIVERGIEQFCNDCESKVLMYTEEWEQYISRIARWVEFENSYKTMDATYTESVWWALSEMNKKGLVYEGRKVLLYCAHCETPVSKAETTMDSDGYKDVTDDAVTVEFRLKDEQGTSILAWTTTPWTLPANMGLAVDPEVDYVKIEKKDERPDGSEGDLVRFILAKELLEKIFPDDEYKILEEMKGSALVGLLYEPLYDIPAVTATGKKAYYIMPADFVTTDDGTGVVHTAVIYGEDDYQLGLEHDLPMVPLLLENGHFNDDAPELVRGKYFKQANKIVIEDLKERGLLFADEKYTHSYPHCWRCKNPLIYNAISSWFVNIGKVKDRLIELNKDINWVPDHLKDGRFGKILEGAPDWNISRNRFWASPLPIWKCEDCKETKVVGSVDEMAEEMKTSGNTYYIMRHGESHSNVDGRISSVYTNSDGVTNKGKEDIKQSASELKDKNIDVIVHSDFVRTTETSKQLALELGLDQANLVVEPLLRELATGQFEGGKWADYHANFSSDRGKFEETVPGEGENFTDVKRRVFEALCALEEKYQNKNILIVSHGLPIEFAHMVSVGASTEQMIEARADRRHMHKTAEWRELPFKPLPHNSRYDLDLHKPYVDKVRISCPCGGEMTRIPEVVDCWVESGSMPFAEHHYPFENKELFESHFPGDFISEYVGQTRTWFYYMLVVSGILFDEASFKNVVVTGNVQADDGQKMSKSLGNYTDPLLNIDRFGADALRYYLMANPIMVGEDVAFRDDELKEIYQRLLNILSNVNRFYTTFSDEAKDGYQALSSENVLDRWILARLSQIITEVTKELDAYNTAKAGRPIRDFVTDLSTWFVRRSRDRFKSDDEEDKQYALATLRYVLLELSKVMAPYTPFISEEVYQSVKEDSDKLSVHLDDWPKAPEVDSDEVLELMAEVRRVVSLALEKRSASGVKVRQPLSKLTVKSEKLKAADKQYLALIQDEINIKEVVFDKAISDEVELDVTLTDELKEEGQIRELSRHIQDLRKKQKLAQQDEVNLVIVTDAAGKEAIERHLDVLKKSVRAREIELNEADQELVDLDGLKVAVTLG